MPQYLIVLLEIEVVTSFDYCCPDRLHICILLTYRLHIIQCDVRLRKGRNLRA